MLFGMSSTKIVEIKHWALSAKKHTISLTKSCEKPDRPILLIGGVHGDEPEGVWLAEAVLAWLKSNSAQTSEATQYISATPHISATPWIVITCLNPDGYVNCERVNGNNVDLNRNYPSKSWSPTFEKERYNPGPAPGSEPEIKALVQLINETQPRLIIHCHSWHPCIICTGEPGMAAAQALADCSGYELRDEIGYPTPGSLSQYGWHDLRIPIICIEEAEGTMQKEVWPHFSKAFETIFYGREKEKGYSSYNPDKR